MKVIPVVLGDLGLIINLRKHGQTLHSRTDHEPDGLHATRGTVLVDPNCELALGNEVKR